MIERGIGRGDQRDGVGMAGAVGDTGAEGDGEGGFGAAIDLAGELGEQGLEAMLGARRVHPGQDHPIFLAADAPELLLYGLQQIARLGFDDLRIGARFFARLDRLLGLAGSLDRGGDGVVGNVRPAAGGGLLFQLFALGRDLFAPLGQSGQTALGGFDFTAQGVALGVFFGGLLAGGEALSEEGVASGQGKVSSADGQATALEAIAAASENASKTTPVSSGKSDGPDPRIRLARVAERALRYLSPEPFAIHPVEAEEPEEDMHLLDVSFVSPAVDAIARVPSYQAWFCQVDQLPAYRYMRRLIQLLLWQRPGRWLGKTPHHLEYLDELLTVFPDAKVVITHRDPTRTVASFCSMMGHSRAMFADRVDPKEIGRQFSAKAIRAVERSMQARQRIDPRVFLDVLYQHVIRDPLEQVRRVYDFIGLELEPATESAMNRWLRDNSQTKHGVHGYELEDFGLSREDLDPHFKAYRDQYGVPIEV